MKVGSLSKTRSLGQNIENFLYLSTGHIIFLIFMKIAYNVHLNQIKSWICKLVMCRLKLGYNLVKSYTSFWHYRRSFGWAIQGYLVLEQPVVRKGRYCICFKSNILLLLEVTEQLYDVIVLVILLTCYDVTRWAFVITLCLLYFIQSLLWTHKISFYNV